MHPAPVLYLSNEVGKKTAGWRADRVGGGMGELGGDALLLTARRVEMGMGWCRHATVNRKGEINLSAEHTWNTPDLSSSYTDDKYS